MTVGMKSLQICMGLNSQEIGDWWRSSTRCSDLDWSWSSECSFVGMSWCSLDVSNLWILQACWSILNGSCSHGLVVWLNDGLNDMDSIASSTVSSSHFTIHLGDGSAKSDISIFFVHVDDTSSCKISKHDSVVLDRVWFSLEDLTHRDDFTLSSSDLVLSLHVVPELGPSNNSVLGKDSDSIASWLWFSFTWNFSTNDPVLVDLLSFKSVSTILMTYGFLHGCNSYTFDHCSDLKNRK